jgi:formamidopyrimidine-DNA glycosylase
MPELPEVETVRRGLAPHMIGATLVGVETRRAGLRFPFPDDFVSRLSGQRLTRLDRRAKYLLAGLSSGDVLVIHLGMTGRLTVKVRAQNEVETLGAYIYETAAADKHDHVVFQLSNGVTVTYNDPRRFGFMMVTEAATLNDQPMFHRLGVEPLSQDLTPDYLAGRANGRRGDLKAFLMDQSIIAGLGNIYVCEALHRAGLSPHRKAASLSNIRSQATVRAQRLVPAVRSVLVEALKAGGSTLRDYRTAAGDSGSFQESFAVYDRAGQPCQRNGCDGSIKRAVQSARSTFYCSRCQR